jgi:hypothetical protein
LDPAFIATRPADDPLFVPERDPELAGLELPEVMRQYGLNLVNADGFDDPEQRFVMRSVSHTLSLSTSLAAPPSEEGAPTTIDDTTTPPLQRTGWSGDGAPGNGELRDFTDGAIVQHATRSLARVPGVDFVLPSDAERDAITSFMMNLGRKNELDLSVLTLSDAAAERGRASFISGPARECDSCHHNAGANSLVTDDVTNESFLANFSADTGVESARIAALDELGIPADGGFGRRSFDSDGDGVADAFGNRRFNIPPLIEAADTGPFFHTNAFATLEQAIGFYTSPEFAASQRGRGKTPTRPQGGPFQLDADQIQELGRFLRVLNAAFNCQLAAARLDATLTLIARAHAESLAVERNLLRLADVEITDAARVLAAQTDLNLEAQAALRRARAAIEVARCTDVRRTRRSQTTIALGHVSEANNALGQGIRFDVGESTLMY